MNKKQEILNNLKKLAILFDDYINYIDYPIADKNAEELEININKTYFEIFQQVSSLDN